ncbi:hypothetical protein AAHA92_01922 [Salvia divinorum]|uniref:Pectinesterase inhibitor domain-containing protein n=1 Tax=Salvia divinorum TaxID=28513 RepID=A0ABD1IEP5_SALDI
MTDETSLSISTQETPLLPNDSSPQPPKIKNLKAKLVFLLRIVIVLIAAILTLYFIYSKNRKKPEPLSHYQSGLSDFYCHLTPHPKLCRDSMSSATNATALQPSPHLLFATSLQLVITQLNHTAASIDRALNASRPGLTTCQTLIRDSLSQLSGSAGLDFFPYVEDNELIKDEVQGAIKSNSGNCLLALRGIDGVEEVKSGVEKGRKLWVNYISLYNRRMAILNDFNTRLIYEEDEGYNYVFSYIFGYNRFYWYGIDYAFLVCLYSVMYLFIALLYFLFWQ